MQEDIQQPSTFRPHSAPQYAQPVLPSCSDQPRVPFAPLFGINWNTPQNLDYSYSSHRPTASRKARYGPKKDRLSMDDLKVDEEGYATAAAIATAVVASP